MAMEHDDSSSGFTAGVSLLAASFSPSQADNMFYGGNYEGVAGGLQWATDRYSVGASGSYYRLARNGDEQYGVGDLSANAQVALVHQTDLHAGVLAAVSVPTGNENLGLGMGHIMVMPAAYVAARAGTIALTGSFGYSRALASGGHVHGMMPLVEPMNMSELTWSVGGDVPITTGVRGGARFTGGVPIGAMAGTDRVIGAARIAWGSARVDTAVELQAGLVGDPFTIRGVVSTALRF
ncbi:MAG: hypothetical protein JO257_20690 [Deltaproteobacteria bacterium]|nr:hypothetical protein [Deltaproteobacteria bacterium]